MHCWIELDRNALLNNFQIFRSIAPQSQIAPVLKSNAYGHGLKETYEILKEAMPTWLVVAYLSEAGELRKLGFKGRLLIVTPVFEDEFKQAVELDAEIFLGDHACLKPWLEVKQKPKIHLKFDTGLSRQGFFTTEAADILAKVKPFKDRVIGICTHFANVEDVLEHEYATKQLSRFSQVGQIFAKGGVEVIRHASSSASTLILNESRLDLSRVGIAMYGLWPSPSTRLSYLQINAKVAALKPVLSWKTRIASVKSIRAGDFVGYGCTYKAMTDMKIAILPLGYFEGYTRLCGNDQSYVLIRGKRCPLLGRISMNLMTVSVNHLSTVEAGDVVTLIGQDGEEQLDASTVSAWAETIHYEFVSRLNTSIPRNIL